MQTDSIVIEVVASQVVNKVAKNGNPYEALELTFKNLRFNKVEQKLITPFGTTRNIKDALTGAAPGTRWTVSRIKDGQYWNWTEVIAGGEETMAQNTPTPQAAKPAYTRDFESKDERQERQVLIVRQSSLSSAVATLAAGAKTAVSPDAVIDLAERYVQFVFGRVDVESPVVDE